MNYRLKYTKTFEKQIEKIKKKDKALMEEATKKAEKLQEMPNTGKPLRYMERVNTSFTLSFDK